MSEKFLLCTLFHKLSVHICQKFYSRVSLELVQKLNYEVTCCVIAEWDLQIKGNVLMPIVLQFFTYGFHHWWLAHNKTWVSYSYHKKPGQCTFQGDLPATSLQWNLNPGHGPQPGPHWPSFVLANSHPQCRNGEIKALVIERGEVYCHFIWNFQAFFTYTFSTSSKACGESLRLLKWLKMLFVRDLGR